MRIIQSLVLNNERSVSRRTVHQRSPETANVDQKLGNHSVDIILGQEGVSACCLNTKLAISGSCQHTGIYQDSNRERERDTMFRH